MLHVIVGHNIKGFIVCVTTTSICLFAIDTNMVLNSCTKLWNFASALVGDISFDCFHDGGGAGNGNASMVLNHVRNTEQKGLLQYRLAPLHFQKTIFTLYFPSAILAF